MALGLPGCGGRGGARKSEARTARFLFCLPTTTWGWLRSGVQPDELLTDDNCL